MACSSRHAPARVVASVESSAVAELDHSETELAARVREILERITGGLGLRCRIEIVEEDESLVATLSEATSAS